MNHKDKSIKSLKSSLKNKVSKKVSEKTSHNKNRTLSTLNGAEQYHPPYTKEFNENTYSKSENNNNNPSKPRRILVNIDESEFNMLNNTGYFGNSSNTDHNKN